MASRINLPGTQSSPSCLISQTLVLSVSQIGLERLGNCRWTLPTSSCVSLLLQTDLRWPDMTFLTGTPPLLPPGQPSTSQHQSPVELLWPRAKPPKQTPRRRAETHTHDEAQIQTDTEGLTVNIRLPIFTFQWGQMKAVRVTLFFCGAVRLYRWKTLLWKSHTSKTFTLHVNTLWCKASNWPSCNLRQLTREVHSSGARKDVQKT